jgi:hypothetical protein
MDGDRNDNQRGYQESTATSPTTIPGATNVLVRLARARRSM